jgi:hypothetical protein
MAVMAVMAIMAIMAIMDLHIFPSGEHSERGYG